MYVHFLNNACFQLLIIFSFIQIDYTSAPSTSKQSSEELVSDEGSLEEPYEDSGSSYEPSELDEASCDSESEGSSNVCFFGAL